MAVLSDGLRTEMLTVMIVDPQAKRCRQLAAMLGKLGYHQIRMAYSLSQAALSSLSEIPRLVMICLEQPEEQTARFITELRARTRHLYVVFYSEKAYMPEILNTFSSDARLVLDRTTPEILGKMMSGIENQVGIDLREEHYFLEKAVVDIFVNNSQAFMGIADQILKERLSRKYYYIYLERDEMSPLRVLTEKVMEYTGDPWFYNRLYKTLETCPDLYLHIYLCVQIRRHRFLMVCEPLDTNSPLTRNQLQKFTEHVRQHLKDSDITSPLSMMVFPKPQTLMVHYREYTDIRHQFYYKYWNRRPTVVWMQPGEEMILEEYTADFSLIDRLIAAGDRQVLAYIDEVFSVPIQNRDYGGFKVLYLQMDHYLGTHYPEGYIPVEHNDMLRLASLEDALFLMKQGIEALISSQNVVFDTPHAKDAAYITRFLLRNYHRSDLSLEDIAGETQRYTKNYLNEIYKKETGNTVMEALRQIRMDSARQLLCRSQTKILDIAAMTGFHTVQYFTRIFKKETGMTPMEFRQKYRNQTI